MMPRPQALQHIKLSHADLEQLVSYAGPDALPKSLELIAV